MADKIYKLIFTKDDGSEDIVQFTAPQGEPGEPGKTPVKGTDYFTDADKQEIAGQAAELVEIPDVDLTGYATEEYVKDKIAEAELGGEEVDLSGYAQKSELPTKVSQLENDSGYLTEHQDISGKLDANKLPEAINTALEQAKASGEFDGKDGVDGKDGAKGDKGDKGDTGATGATGAQGEPGKDGADGQPGKDGSNGKDGTSATHSWNGTVLTITSASGTSSADLKGAKGDKGDKGDTGATGNPGADGVSPTVAVSKSGKVTTVSITDKNGTKTATINDGADGSPGSAGKDGTSVTVKSVSESTADGGSNVVTFSDGKTVTIKNGSKGSTGATGATGSKGADGKTPIKGVDFWTAADQESIVQDVIAALGTPVFGRVDADNNIVLTGNLVEGNSYAVKYEDAEGNVMDVGSIVFEAPPAYTNLLESAGYVKDKRLSSTDGTTVKDAAGFYLTGYIPIPLNGVVRFQGINNGGSSYGNTVYIYDSSKKFLGAPASTGLNETGRDCEAVYENGYLKQFTAKSTIMKSSPAFVGGYMRFGAVSISDGAIITVNEEIV